MRYSKARRCDVFLERPAGCADENVRVILTPGRTRFAVLAGMSRSLLSAMHVQDRVHTAKRIGDDTAGQWIVQPFSINDEPIFVGTCRQ